MENNNQRLVAVSLSMAVPDILMRVLTDQVELSTYQTGEFSIKRDEDAVLFYMRVYRKYHQDEAFRSALDREFLYASTRRWTIEGMEKGTASLHDYGRAIRDLKHPVLEECSKGLDLPYHVSRKEREQRNV